MGGLFILGLGAGIILTAIIGAGVSWGGIIVAGEAATGACIASDMGAEVVMCVMSEDVGAAGAIITG